ncbi:MAG: hypothetical protein J6C96_12410 [Oscillospiraceae bacterium]|nr:hypothetical protein [Oscillospiraceae bacterium]
MFGKTEKKPWAAVLAASLLLCSCEKNPDNDGYHVYSNGTAVSETEYVEPLPPKNRDYADFYIPDGMVTDYISKNCLTDREKEIYESILPILGNLKPRTELPPEGSEVYGRLLEVARHEQLSFCHISKRDVEYSATEQQFDVLFEYRFDADEISRMNLASEKTAKEIMSQLTPDMDDYEKLKFFHDYLILNCENSTSDEYADTVYGALVRKKALCEGYAKAFSYLCNLAGIENVIVTGQTTVPHMWNMVKTGGSWYHVDVTWDNPDDKLHEAYPDVILYQYFMVTDAVIKNNHAIWAYPIEPPKADGIDENYFSREGADVSRDGELLQAAENAIIDAVESGRSGAMIKFSSNDLYISVLSDLNAGGGDVFNPIIRRIKTDYGTSIRLSWTDYYEQYRILTFIIEYE